LAEEVESMSANESVQEEAGKPTTVDGDGLVSGVRGDQPKAAAVVPAGETVGLDTRADSPVSEETDCQDDRG